MFLGFGDFGLGAMETSMGNNVERIKEVLALSRSLNKESAKRSSTSQGKLRKEYE